MAGWTDDIGKATALTVGCVVAIAASIAGDTSQDLKTGFLLGGTPRNQQIGELAGVNHFSHLRVFVSDPAGQSIWFRHSGITRSTSYFDESCH